MYSEFIKLKINDVYNFLAYYSKFNTILNSNLLNHQGDNKMGKTTALVQNSLDESLAKLMSNPEVSDGRKNKIINEAQKPSNTRGTRGGHIQVRYTCVTGEARIICTLEEPRIAAPRATCPVCSGTIIEGYGLRGKLTCYFWEILG